MKYLPIKVFLTLLSFLFVAEAFSTSLTVSGNVSGTWSADTVLVTDHLMIPVNETLIIAPGTRVEFQSYFRLEVQGRLIAEGTPGDTILFTIRDTSNFYSQTSGRGGWSGIRFINTPPDNDSSYFSFCRFEFGKAAEDSANCYGGAIQMKNFGKARIEHCYFYHNYSFYSGGAVYLRNASAIIRFCRFNNNYSGNTGTIYGYGGGVCSLYSSPVVNNNDFYSNSSTGVGGAASFDNADPMFNNNRMMYNFSGLGGALGVLRSSPTHTLSNNLAAENACLFFGGGICCIRSFPVFSNLTISDNSSAYGGGFYCNDSAAPKMYNSIIYNNHGFGSSVYIWDVYSAPSFYYCNIEGDTAGFEGSGGHEGYHGEYLNNLNLPPSFYGSGNYPYQLNSGSPCIDSGTPDAGFLNVPETDLGGGGRIWNGRIDMGVYEYDGTTDTRHHKENKSGDLFIYPCPANDYVVIRVYPSIKHPSELKIISLQGELIHHYTIETGESEIRLDLNKIANPVLKTGLYYVILSNETQMLPGRLLISGR
jgi:hypothetical protein